MNIPNTNPRRKTDLALTRTESGGATCPRGAILVHLEQRQTEWDGLSRLEELVELVRAGGYESRGVVSGRKQVPSPSHFLGSGKVKELVACVHETGCQTVVVNHSLTSVQARNLNQETGAAILDRTGLILEIFSERAKSYEGKLQVELARLQYAAGRLVRGWSHLERQKGGIGLRGPGETQLETDRRLIAKRVSTLEGRLRSFEKHRAIERRSRAGAPLVALVGYTNVGKSTLFREWTGAPAEVADQLFATLDPTWRQLRLPFGTQGILVDTVGFIRDLPHELVAAFRATLSETRLADLILHVVDASAPGYRLQIDVVNQVLEEIGAGTVPRIEVMNKIDRLGRMPELERNPDGMPERVWISADQRTGFDLLGEATLAYLKRSAEWGSVIIDDSEGAFRAALYSLGAVRSEHRLETGRTEMTLCLTPADRARLTHRFHFAPERWHCWRSACEVPAYQVASGG